MMQLIPKTHEQRITEIEQELAALKRVVGGPPVSGAISGTPPGSGAISGYAQAYLNNAHACQNMGIGQSKAQYAQELAQGG